MCEAVFLSRRLVQMIVLCRLIRVNWRAAVEYREGDQVQFSVERMQRFCLCCVEVLDQYI